MLKRYRLRDYDFRLVIMLIAISVIGVLVIGSAKEVYRERQIMGLIIGLVIMVVMSLIDYGMLLNFYWVFYGLNFILLLLVKIMGTEAGGAQRWLNLFGIQFQPSETAKILLILFYAQFIMKHKEKINSPRILITMVLLLIPPLLLVLKQPDLSTSILIMLVFAVVIFVGGLSYRLILGFLIVMIPLTIIFFGIVLQPNQNLIEDYQQTRILAWLHPEKYANAEGYQQANSVMAIGSGELIGKGLDNNIVGSVKNGNFISEPQTDFIFAIVGEELGFIGSCIVIILLFLIALECVMVAKRAKDVGGVVICSGIAAIVGFQSFMNIAVATSIMPNTGIPLPFVSYGLTSLVSLYTGMGIVLNIRLQGKKYYI